MNHGTILASLVLDDHGSVLAPPQLTPLGAFELERFGELRAAPARPSPMRSRTLSDAAVADDERVREAVRGAIRQALDLPRQRRPIVEVQITRLGRRHPGRVRARGGGRAMIGRLNHVAIAVPDIAAAARQYRDVLGAEVSAVEDQPDHGVQTVFIELPNTKIELLGVLGEASPIAGFLDKNPAGGIHHVCYEVDDILAARDRLKAQGARVLGDGEPKIGAHGKPVLFLHPKDFNGTLVELEQA